MPASAARPRTPVARPRSPPGSRPSQPARARRLPTTRRSPGRYSALAIDSHWGIEDWGRFVPEHTTAVSILNRLLHHATVVVTNGQSYRMRDARQRRGEPTKSS